MEIIDTYGVPEYFVTHMGAIEDAGAGMIRAVHCIERNGVMIPVFSRVMPALSLLRIGPVIREFAQRIACSEVVDRQMAMN